MSFCQKFLLFQVLVILLSIPAAVRAEEVFGPPPPSREFKEGCVFLGIAKKGEALIALYLREERWTHTGLLINAVLVPTEKFPFETGYRGFQKKADYRLKKGRGLHLTFDGRMENFTLLQHVDIGDTSPIMVGFISKGKNKDLIPDDIEKMELKVKDVSKWVKVPKKELPMWSRSFENLETISGKERRRTGAQAGVSGKNRAVPRNLNEEDYRGRYVTLNGTYLFERKTVYSKILAVFDVGTFLEHTKPAGRNWMEVLYGDSGQKGYALAVYLVDNKEEALRWEREKDLSPVEPPLGKSRAEAVPEEATEP